MRIRFPCGCAFSAEVDNPFYLDSSWHSRISHKVICETHREFYRNKQIETEELQKEYKLNEAKAQVEALQKGEHWNQYRYNDEHRKRVKYHHKIDFPCGCWVEGKANRSIVGYSKHPSPSEWTYDFYDHGLCEMHRNPLKDAKIQQELMRIERLKTLDVWNEKTRPTVKSEKILIP